MDLQDAFSSSEYVEYVITGAHTAVWMAILGLYLFGVPLSTFLNLSLVTLIIVLPFTYVLGVIMSSVSQVILTPLRALLKRIFIHYSVCPDEYIAAHSPTLYAAYEWRMRRTRIPGAAVLNWLLLGLMLLLFLGNPRTQAFEIIIIATVVLTVLSIFTWFDLYRRAFKFRRQACIQLSYSFDGTSSASS
jgi:Mn2+/Fe2+ NRAMP family transporter